MKKNLAEFLGAFWLVLGGCGSAVLALGFPDVGIGPAGVAMAFGLAFITFYYAMGHLSGAHLNPAVTLGMWASGRMALKEVVPYIAAQVAGAIAAAAVLYLIVRGNGSDIGNFAANGYGSHSPGNYSLLAALLTEFITTFMFLLIVLGATNERAPKGFGGIAIGLTLTLVHLISMPVTNTSVNPARSLSQALFVGGWALEQLWLFIIIPIIAALAAGFIYRYLSGRATRLEEVPPAITREPVVIVKQVGAKEVE